MLSSPAAKMDTARQKGVRANKYRFMYGANKVGIYRVLALRISSCNSMYRCSRRALKPRSSIIPPKALHAYAQMGGQADQFRFKTSCSRRSKKKTDHKAEHQNRHGGDNQSRNQRSKHGSKADRQ